MFTSARFFAAGLVAGAKTLLKSAPSDSLCSAFTSQDTAHLSRFHHYGFRAELGAKNLIMPARRALELAIERLAHYQGFDNGQQDCNEVSGEITIPCREPGRHTWQALQIIDERLVPGGSLASGAVLQTTDDRIRLSGHLWSNNAANP